MCASHCLKKIHRWNITYSKIFCLIVWFFKSLCVFHRNFIEIKGLTKERSTDQLYHFKTYAFSYIINSFFKNFSFYYLLLYNNLNLMISSVIRKENYLSIIRLDITYTQLRNTLLPPPDTSVSLFLLHYFY